jgi:hypothetical protein
MNEFEVARAEQRQYRRYALVADTLALSLVGLLVLAREGAKARMRLVILTQDANVETLGISGQGAVRCNFTRLLLRSFAVQALPESRGLAWPAMLEHRGSLRAVDRSHLPKLALQRTRRARVWEVPETARLPKPTPQSFRGTFRALQRHKVPMKRLRFAPLRG